MTVQRPQRTSPAEVPLARLLEDLRVARENLALARRTPGNTEACHAARVGVVSALEAYAGALEARCLPVPYALRDELRIRKRACR